MKAAVVRVLGLFASVLVAGAAAAQSTQAVEWKVSEGGNGHWYQGVFHSADGVSWTQARTQALSRGGELVSLNSPQERQWVFVNVSSNQSLWTTTLGPWVGGLQPDGSPEPSGGWVWVDGEPLYGGFYWDGAHPDGNNNCGGPANKMAYWGNYTHGVGDLFVDCADAAHLKCWNIDFGFHQSSVVEWSADCNGDGVVDYGQILRGELEDLNSNGVPDICETSISSVLPPSVPAQGGSTITIRGNAFPVNPTVLVGGVPATNVVRESLTRITATSPAGMPGMKSVSVNGFTLPDGIYVRPECGSDLDQNGIVDAADISIILLDFGQCYETPLVAPADLVPPLLEAQSASELPVRR